MTTLDAHPLVIPLPFNPSASQEGLDPKHIDEPPSLLGACANATPTVLISWLADSLNGIAVAMGCDDGSTFLFSSTSSPPPTAVRSSSNALSRSEYRRKQSMSASSVMRPPSPAPSKGSHRSSMSHSQPPNLVQPRSRILSSLSKAQVEAPKTFVDYDDEQDKLRAMLKNNSTSGNAERKPKLSADSEHLTNSSAMLLSPKEEDRPSSRMSDSPASASPTLSLPQPLPPPLVANPFMYELSGLSLKLHVTPPRMGFGHAVTSLKILEGGRSFACLQQCGSLSIFSSLDGHCLTSARMDELPRIQPPSGCKGLPQSLGFYSWTGMRVAQDGESTLLFLTASEVHETAPYATADPEKLQNQAVSRITVVRVCSPSERDFVSSPEEILEKVGEWMEDGPAQSVGLHVDKNGELLVYHISQSSRLIFRSVHFLPHPPSPTLEGNALPPHHNSLIGQSLSMPQLSLQLNIPNPFKSSSTVRHRRNQSHHVSWLGRPQKYTAEPGAISDDDGAPRGRVELGNEKHTCSIEFPPSPFVSDGELRGVAMSQYKESVMGCIWSDACIIVFRVDSDNSLTKLTEIVFDSVKVVSWVNERMLVALGEDAGAVFEIRGTDANNDEMPSTPTGNEKENNIIYSAAPLITFPLGDITSSQCLLSPFSVLVSSGHGSSLRIENVSFSLNNGSPPALPQKPPKDVPKARSRTVWEPPSRLLEGVLETEPLLRATSILPLDHATLITGLSDGLIGKGSLQDVLAGGRLKLLVKSAIGLDSSIKSVNIVKNSRTKEAFVVGSSSDGSLAVWHLLDLKLCARWTLFATPLLSIIDLTGEDNVGRLKDCMLCVAEHGTIAVIVIDGFELLYLIPGSSCPLERICIGGDNLLLIYSDAKARLWDVKSQEFWRSMAKEKADDLLDQGGWFEVYVETEGPHFDSSMSGAFGVAKATTSSSDNACTLYVDIREMIESSRDPSQIPPSRRVHRATSSIDSPTASSEPPAKKEPPIDLFRSLLSALISAGLDKDSEQLCQELLRGKRSSLPRICGTTGFRGTSTAMLLPLATDLKMLWKVSAPVTTQRLLSIVSVLRAAMIYEELESAASQLAITFASSLPELVGAGYCPPALPLLTRYWFDPCGEIKQAARSIFNAVIQGMSDDEAIEVVKTYKNRLPFLQPEAKREAPYAASALIIAGQVAVENYTLLPTGTLTDIAKSIALYLHDDASAHRVIAIELCSAGFHIWQHYVDAMEVLRALFVLATSPKKDSGLQGAAPQARAAILQIASSNVPLFMTTLSLDILNPGSMEYRKSVMQLVAFIIRKKPLVLYPNLPRLLEAVVKSLDPNSSTGREAVLDAAIEILGHVVRTFPAVDFHKATQRLAVGTNEGAIVMYDLKTATRLYVLEGHKRRISALSFSPDGRRLVSASLEESVVMVWKVGSSLVSVLFNPLGAPPRQGGAGESEAYKKLDFNVGDEAHMTVASTLDWVAFEWPSERTARLKIRDSVLTFNT